MRHRPGGRLPTWAIGLATALVIAIAMLLAFARELPWGERYELGAVFSDVQGLSPDAPVRIAGVDVGNVTEIDHVDGADEAGTAIVRMELDDGARPIATDATVKIRPRLFLEGNYFLELRPGTPSAPEADEGYTLPLGQTAAPVQLDEVLTTLQSDVRGHLRVVLDQLGGALSEHGGAAGLRRFYRASPGAFRTTARVSDAALGTAPHDLSELVANLQRVVAGLGRNDAQLQGTVTSLNAVGAALAAESAALERAVALLPKTIDAARPVLAALNDSFPATRAFALEARPGVEALPPALDAATPLLAELRGLVRRDELRGVAADLRRAAPKLARLTRRTLPFMSEARALSSCFNEIVVPWANSTVPDPETPATGRIFEETSYGLVGIGGESRSFDGNGPYARVLGGTGANFVVFPPLEGETDEVLGVTPLPLLGARPAIDSSAKSPFRPDVPCETNELADLDSGQAGAPPDSTPFAQPSIDAGPALREKLADSAELFARVARLADGTAAGPGAAGGAIDRSLVARVRALTDEAVGGLDRALAAALGWEALLERDGGGEGGR
jgi:virulence factor Mce-like protein